MIQPGYSRGTTRFQLYNKLPMAIEAKEKKSLGGELQAIRCNSSLVVIMPFQVNVILNEIILGLPKFPALHTTNIPCAYKFTIES